MRKVKLLPTRDCEASYGPDRYPSISLLRKQLCFYLLSWIYLVSHIILISILYTHTVFFSKFMMEGELRIFGPRRGGGGGTCENSPTEAKKLGHFVLF